MRPTILHLLPPASANPWLESTVRAIDPSRFRLLVATLAPRGPLHESLERVGIDAISLEAPRRRAYPAALLRLRRLVSRSSIDLVHAHLLDAAILAALAGRPWLLTRHESLGVFESMRTAAWRRRALLALDGATLRAANAVVAPSRRSRGELLASGVLATRIRDIHLGFDLDELEHVDVDAVARARDEFGLAGRVSAVAAGRLSHEKRIDVLLRSWVGVRAEHPGARLIVAGDGPLRAALESLARGLGLGDGVVFTGFRHDARSLMTAADMVIHPSHTESTGMVVVEALAQERPLVVTPVGIVGEDLEDGAHCIVVPHNDAAAIRAAVARLVADPTLGARLGRAGRVRVRERFDQRAIVPAYERLYDTLLAR